MPNAADLKHALRDLLEQRPWLKWAGPVVAVLFVVMVFFMVRGGGGQSSSTAALADTVEVRFEDTGETMEVAVGFIRREVYARAGEAREDWKLTNLKTGKQTGVVSDGSRWSRIIAEVNEDKRREAGGEKR